MATTKAQESRQAAHQDTKCVCGCGATVVRSFKPGHDQRFLSQIRRAVACGELPAEQAMAQARTVSEKFATKVSRSLEAVAREQERTATANEKAGHDARTQRATKGEASK